MQSPFQLTFRSMERSEALAAHLQQRVAKLEHLFDRIISCHVVVELEGRRHRHGDRYRVSIHVGLPGQELSVTHGPPPDQDSENPYATSDRAFDEAGRQLEDWVRRRRSRSPITRSA